MAGLALTALFGFVAFVLSYGFFVPSDLRYFSFLGAVGSMAGYPLGELTARAVSTAWTRAALIILSAIICVATVVCYAIFVQRGTGEVADIVLLAILLTCIFLSFTFLMPMAGVTIGKLPAA
jgi:hypothetical protein